MSVAAWTPHCSACFSRLSVEGFHGIYRGLLHNRIANSRSNRRGDHPDSNGLGQNQSIARPGSDWSNESPVEPFRSHTDRALGSGSSMLCPPTIGIPASAALSASTSQDFLEDRKRKFLRFSGNPTMFSAIRGWAPMAYRSLRALAAAIEPKGTDHPQPA